MNNRAPSRCSRVPFRLAIRMTASIAAASKISPFARRTGVSIETTDTDVLTRPVCVPERRVSKSSGEKVAFPGASGIMGRLLKV